MLRHDDIVANNGATKDRCPIILMFKGRFVRADLFSLGSTLAWQVDDDRGYPDLSRCFSRPLGFRLSFGAHLSPGEALPGDFSLPL